MYIAKREEIRRRREEKGVTRCKLSTESGLAKNALLRIERGEFERTHPIRAKAIAEALNCEVTDIFINEKDQSS